jgi:hypothetical protein
MKKNKYILCLGVIFLIAACTDILETTPKSGIVSDASFFKTTADFDAFMYGIYIDVQGGFGGGYGVDAWISVTQFISGEMRGPDELRRPIDQAMTASNGSFLGMWNEYYKISAKANQILAKLPDAAIPDADKTRLEGEALFFRGFAYYNIAEAFGNAPLILTPYETSQNLMECTPEAQIWDQVVADFTAALPKIPTKEQWGTSNLGRVTKGTVYAYLANTYMWREDWANAETASNSLIALGTYSLMPDLRSVFSLANQNNVESIWEVQYRDIPDGNVTWNGHTAGSVLPEDCAPRNIGNEWAPAAGWGEMVGSNKLGNSFEPGDDRRATLLKMVGDKYKGELMTDTLLIPNTITQVHSSFSTKYWYGGSPAGSGATYSFGNNVPVFRYAEFLLNYAEILFHQGKTAQAYEQMNLVRARAKLPDLPESSDMATFMTALMKERRAELNFEPNWWWHLIRTKTADEFLLAEYGDVMNPNWYKWPIPQAERDQNPNLCQNEGY